MPRKDAYITLFIMTTISFLGIDTTATMPILMRRKVTVLTTSRSM